MLSTERRNAVNPHLSGTKAAVDYALTIGPGESSVVRLRLSATDLQGQKAFDNFEETFSLRKREADEYYATVVPQSLSADAQNVMRQGPGGHVVVKAVLTITS